MFRQLVLARIIDPTSELGSLRCWRRQASRRSSTASAPPGEQEDLTPLVQTVRRWWFEADAWRDPQAQREFLARRDTYRNEGPPPPERRTTREQIRARFGI